MRANRQIAGGLVVAVALAVAGCGQGSGGVSPSGAIQSGMASLASNNVTGGGESLYAVNGSLRVTRRVLSVFRPTYDVKQGSQLLGVIQQKFFAATSSWRLMDPQGADIGLVEQAAFSFGYKGLVRTARGTVVGTVRQDVLGSLIRPGVVLKLLDANGQIIVRSAPVYFSLREDVKLYDASDALVGRLIAPWFSWNQARDLHLEKALDRRMLLAFLAAQIDLSYRRSESSASPRPSAAPPNQGESPLPLPLASPGPSAVR